MASSLSANVKVSATIQLTPVSGSDCREPTGISETFVTKYRAERDVRPIAANGSLTITKSSEGLTSIDLFQLKCLTVGKNINIAFDGDSAGMDLNAITAKSEAFLLCSGDFTTAVITNLDAVNAIDVEYGFFEAVS